MSYMSHSPRKDGGTNLKKFLLIALVAMFVLGFAATALAATPTVIGADGASTFTYSDLRDSGVKYSGGYSAFETSFTVGQYYNGSALTSGTATGGYATNPHGGYSASSNKCKVCHAVHRAEGAYYLLRADSQSDACDYCHIGGSAHSAKIVYDLNPAGTDTTNGHTMGAGQVPDSSVKQTAQVVTVSGTDMNGVTVNEDVKVRSYDAAGIEMFRFSRHHSQSPVSTGRSGFKPVGPNSLSCFSCHQPHNAAGQVWQPSKFDPTLVADVPGGNPNGYKLLRRFPSGGFASSATSTLDGTSSLNTYGMIDVANAIKVPETTLTAGTNYSQNASFDGTYSENGITTRRPVWIAQNLSFEYGGTGPAEDPATVNEFALSPWCADCHNLNIGGAEALTNEELGFKAHTERTHPAPFVGAHGGPGQCYSCHRNDLSVKPGAADPAGYGMNQTDVTQNTLTGRVAGASDSCGQCHYGTGAYYVDKTFGRQSDFPHSGSADDIKMLGAYTASTATGGSYTPTFSKTVIGENNLDAVCLRCHPGIGVHN